ncbi:Sulfate adenylyltransferase [Hanseniaspora vineae]
MPAPHGGVLQDLIKRDESKKEQLLKEFSDLEKQGKIINLSARQICDLELILNGGFSPLTGFLNENDYNEVVSNNRLTSVTNGKGQGLLWTIPITLDVEEPIAKKFTVGEKIGLLQDNEIPLAILEIGSIYKPNKSLEAEKVFRGDPDHPAVKYLNEQAGDYYIGGAIVGAIQLPVHYDYLEDRLTPSELRQWFDDNSWTKIVAFQTRNPMHRAHKELTERAAKNVGANVLIHPVVGLTKTGDIDHHTRVKVYKKIIGKYPKETSAKLSLLPIAMRMGGDKEAVWHAIIRQNYGCSHFIVGRSHACPGKNSKGEEFYGPYDAQDMIKIYENELDIDIVPFRMVTYLPKYNKYAPIDEIDLDKEETLNISGTELRNRLKTGEEIPEWFSYPEVVKILRERNQPRQNQGFVLALNATSTTESFKQNGISLTQLSIGLLNKFLEQSGSRFYKIYNTKEYELINDFISSGAGIIDFAQDFDASKISRNVYTIGFNKETDAIVLEKGESVNDILTKVLNFLKAENFFA